MAGNWGEPERMWDEYDWERFSSAKQDGKTEKYMQLLETYLDDPRRDEIIAREMGWTQLLDEKTGARRWTRFWMKTACRRGESDVDNTSASAETFQEHNLYRAASISRSGSINCSIKTLRSRMSPQPLSWLLTRLWPARS